MINFRILTCTALTLLATSFNPMPVHAAASAQPEAEFFMDTDFGRGPIVKAPGEYLSNNGTLAPIENDSLSSLKVPLGRSVYICEHEGNNGHGENCAYFGPGNHRYVGDGFNDETSYIRVEAHSKFGLNSRSKPSCPSIEGLLSSCSTGEKFYQNFEVEIPVGFRAEWWESSKGNDATWNARVVGNKLHISLSVSRTGAFSSANWVEVSVRLVR